MGRKFAFLSVACFVATSVCIAGDNVIADDEKTDEIVKKFYQDEIVKYNPDKYPSLGLSAGTDIFNSPLNYEENSFVLDTRYPISPWTTLWAEAGILKISDEKNEDASGKRFKGGVRFYFH